MNTVRAVVRGIRMQSRAFELMAGMSLAQVLVLEQLRARPASSLGDLATRTGTHQTSVSVVVSRLVKRELVARLRSTRDRRRTELTITDAGREALSRVPGTIQSQLDTALTAWPEADTKKLAELLDRWVTLAGIDETIDEESEPAGGKPNRAAEAANEVGLVVEPGVSRDT